MPITDEQWARQIHQESRGNQAAVSPKGATGVAQVMEGTGPEAAALAGLPWDRNLWKTDARYNEAIGRAYMDKQLDDFGDYTMALAAYNAGPDRTRKTIARFGNNWLSKMPAETREYVANITGGKMPTTSRERISLDDFMPMPTARSDAYSSTSARAKVSLDDYLGPAPSGAADATATAQTGMAPAGQAEAPTIPTQRTDMGEPRSLAQKAGRLALTIGGGMAGGAGGTLLGGPAGGVVGAGLGSAAGSMAAETFDPTQNPTREALTEGVFGAAGQGLALGVGKLLPHTLKPGGKDLLAFLGKQMPTPAQVFDSRALEILHNVGVSSFVGNRALQEAHEAAIRGVQQAGVTWAKQIEANLALGADALEQVSLAAARLNASANIAPVKAAATALAENTPADSAVRNVARILTEARGNTLPFSVTASDVVANAVRNATPGLTPVTPKGAVGLKELRTQLLDIVRNSDNTAEKVAATKLAALMDDAAESSLSRLDPRLAAQWREASSFYKEGIQGEQIGKMFSKASVSGGQSGEISGRQLANALKEHRLDKLPTDLTPQQLEHLNKLAAALQAAEGTGSKAFTLISNGLQVNAVIRSAMTAGLGLAGGAAATGNEKAGLGGAAVVLLGPAAIARALASPRVMRLMLAAARMPEGSKQAGILGTQLISQMFREGILTADEAPQAGAPTLGNQQPMSNTRQ